MSNTQETNEEKRAIIYSCDGKPTKAKDVIPESKLEEFNLNWREKDLPERERTKHVHRLHPYLGKFIPQLVEIFLRKYFKPGDTVLDPFAGSCTTLVQANELKIDSIGADISAFNILLGKVKTDKYDISELKKEIFDVLEKSGKAISSAIDEKQLNLWQTSKRNIEKTKDVYLNTWFSSQALDQLSTYREFIENGNYQYPDVMKIILSRSARSSRLTTHFDLDFPKTPQREPYYCFKHSRTCTPTSDAWKFLKRYSEDTFKRINEYSQIRTNASVSLIHADSRFYNFPKVSGVITSPPYVGLIDYHAQHEYAYHLLGLNDNRNLEIGPALNGSGKKAKFDYSNDISMVFKNSLESMPIGGRLIIVAGDRANLYPSIGEELGIEVEAVVQRHVNRRTGRRSTKFFESIFIWKKIKN